MDSKEFARDVLEKRWLRDTSSHREAYVPESLAKPSRLREGLELHKDGTYSEIGTGATDATIEAEGRWSLDDAGTLILRPGTTGVERRIRIVEASEHLLVFEPQPDDPVQGPR